MIVYVIHDVKLYTALDTVVISGENVCCMLVFPTLVQVSVFSGIWSELLMWQSVYEYQ